MGSRDMKQTEKKAGKEHKKRREHKSSGGKGDEKEDGEAPTAPEIHNDVFEQNNRTRRKSSSMRVS